MDASLGRGAQRAQGAWREVVHSGRQEAGRNGKSPDDESPVLREFFLACESDVQASPRFGKMAVGPGRR
jgi:hypothetical protein